MHIQQLTYWLLVCRSSVVPFPICFPIPFSDTLQDGAAEGPVAGGVPGQARVGWEVPWQDEGEVLGHHGEHGQNPRGELCW